MPFLTESQDPSLELSCSQWVLGELLSPPQKVVIWANLGQKDVHSLESNDKETKTFGVLFYLSQPPDQSPCSSLLLWFLFHCFYTTLVPIHSQAKVFRLLYILWAHYIYPINLLLLKLVSQSPFLLLSTKELWHMQSSRQLRNRKDIKCGVKKKGSMSITQNFKSDH